FAVNAANADTSGHPVYIVFDSIPGHVFATPQTIALAGTLDLHNSFAGDVIEISGPASPVTIAGGGAQSNYSVVRVETGTIAWLTNVNIINGNQFGNGGPFTDVGGGIQNYGTLTISNVGLSSNWADYGGAIYNAGTLTDVVDGTISSNRASRAG